MWFLLLQISLLLVLAAVLGGAVTFWWMKRSYEDVTDSHDQLLIQANRLEGLKQLATREDVKAELSSSVGSLRMPDMGQVNDRLGLLERAVRGISIPEPDLRPISERLEAIETQLRMRMASVEQTIGNVSSAVSRLNNADLQPVVAKLSGIEEQVRAWKAPDVELGPVHSGIAALGLTIDEMKSRNSLEPVQGRLSGLETRIGELFSMVATLRPLQGMLADIEHGISTLDRKPVDLDPLQGGIARLEASLGAVQGELDAQNRRALAPIERGVAGLQEAFAGIPQPDLSPVLDAVVSIDSREDLAALEDRLTAIEYSLAALHHMVRSRSETGVMRSEIVRQARGGAPAANAANGETGAATSMKPPRDSDPINPVRRQGDQANLLAEPAFGPPDNLEQLNGVGPILAGLLQETGVYYFWQVAEWSPEEAAWVDGQLMEFRGRIKRDDWVGHARTLAALPTSARRPAGHSRR